MTRTVAETGTTTAAEHGPEADKTGHPKAMDSPVALAMTFDELLGVSNVPGETADNIIQAVRTWRGMPVDKRRG